MVENLENQDSVKPERAVDLEETAQLNGDDSLAETKDETLETINALKGEIEEACAKADEYLDGWQRARAEFANYKKRVEREQAQVYKTAAGSIIKRYLAIMDDLERALKNCPKEGEGADWASGIELVYRKLVSILESEGVTPMKTEGQLFDPNFHEARSSEEDSDYESGQIIETLTQGYMLGDKVLRPAIVRVAR